MSRKKSEKRDQILTHPIILRVTKEMFLKLQKIQKESSCQSVGEVARKILTREQILCFYQDASMDIPMDELTSIRKELKSIGININQQTKYFHTSDNDVQRAFYVSKTAELYKSIEPKIERLITIISQLAERWLQKS